MKRTTYPHRSVGYFTILFTLFMLFSTPSVSEAQTCNCSDKIYLNDIGTDEVHKFSIGNGGGLTEIGSPWLSTGTITDPHGLATDNNGRVYIGQANSYAGPLVLGPVFQLNASGQVLNNDFFGALDTFSFNFASQNGIIYIPNGSQKVVKAYSLCNGAYLGSMSIDVTSSATVFRIWGFYADETYWYASDRTTGTIIRGLLDISLYANVPTNTGSVVVTTGHVGGTSSTALAPMGVTRDNTGNYYVVINNFNGTNTTEIKKYSPTGVLLSTATDNTQATNTSNGISGFWGARGIAFSKQSGLLYVSSRENCITAFDTNLNEQSALNVGNPTNAIAKGISIATECCPTTATVTVDTSICFNGGTKVFLQDMVACDGVIAEGTWAQTVVGSNTNYNACDNSLNIGWIGCSEFTLSSAGGGNNQCAPFTITLEVGVNYITPPTIDGSQTVCSGGDPLPTAILADPWSPSTIRYQWQSSTTDCNTGFTDIASATSRTYDPPAGITQTTYLRLIAYVDSCNTGVCRDTSNCVTITTTNCPAPTLNPCIAGNTGGQVFRDFGNDGTKGLNDTLNVAGVVGVTVKAYDCNGAEIGSTTTDSKGQYTFASLTPSVSAPIRLEFSTIPAPYSASAAGTNNGTTVQFITATGCNNDLGVNDPSDFCGSNPSIAVPCYVSGNVDLGVLVTFPYSYASDLDGNVNRQTTAFPSRTGADNLGASYKATLSQIGSVHGVAWDKTTKRLFSSAYMKRKVPFGSLGNESTGAIYLNVDPATNATPPSVFVDLNALFPNSTGANPHPIATTDWFADSLTLNSVGKIGLGDLDISRDGKKLYSVNLKEKEIFVIPTDVVPTAGNIQRIPIPTTNLPIAFDPTQTCPANDVRPFGMGIDKDGNLHIGAVCTAETSKDSTDLTLYIWKYNGSVFTLELTQAVNYRTRKRFRYWENPTDLQFNTVTNPGYNDWTNHPMPMVGDIEFDVDGAMIIGIKDRFGDLSPQSYNNSGYPYTRTGGDILRACSLNGGYVLEYGGRCGNTTTAGTSPYNDAADGRGGKEFYFGDTSGDSDRESAQGALLIVPGSGEVVSTAFDPVYLLGNGTKPNNNFNTGGIQKYSNSTGATTGTYDVYLDTDVQIFGKANGLGDIEALCAVQPIEIGNRVWLDTDADGSQDPCESPLSNVVVELWKNNALVAKDTTDANGNYLFNDTQLRYGGIDTALMTTTTYDLKIYKRSTQLDTVRLSTANATANNGNDFNDTDATMRGDSAVIALTTPSVGSNHSYDFGFHGLPDLRLSKTVNNATPALNENVVFTIKIKNEGTGNATGVTVHDTLPIGMTFISALPNGVYDANTKLWTIGNLNAGDSATLTMTVRIDSVGTHYNTAEVHVLNETDTDSSPNNGSTTEDDIASVCVTVPIPVCTSQGKTLTLTVSNALTGIKWFRNGTEISGQTSNTLIVSQIGDYTFTANEATCPVEGCCPVKVIEGNCAPTCKPVVCLSVTVMRL
jgi:uncharacterized repeat protein (TIGR01451 family)